MYIKSIIHLFLTLTILSILLPSGIVSAQTINVAGAGTYDDNNLRGCLKIQVDLLRLRRESINWIEAT